MSRATKHLVKSQKIWERPPPSYGAKQCWLAQVLALWVHGFSNDILTRGHRPIEMNLSVKSYQQHVPQLYLQSSK